MEPDIGHARALDILLNRENPRHEPKRNQEDIIEYLLADEQVYNLARHISVNGLNPLELIAVFRDADGNLIAAEGNRRVCALQLLNDPERAPSDQRPRFKRLSANGNFPEKLLVAKFDNYEEARPWLQVLHDGEQDGIGRRQWRAEQKARNTEKASRHTLTLRLIDYALNNGLLKREDKANLDLTTMTRYLENPQVREAMGIITKSKDPDVHITLPEATFNKIIVKFLGDADRGRIHSRSTSSDWRAYANEIESQMKTAGLAGPGRPLGEHPPAQTATATKQPTKRASLRRQNNDRIQSSDATVQQLNRLNSLKLISIYRSLTSLSLTDHPALLTAGAWVFLESLTALHGRPSTSNFEAYIQGRVNSWGFGKDKRREINLSLRYISENGNAEKHSAVFTSADAKNLRMHFLVLEDAIARLVEECPR